MLIMKKDIRKVVFFTGQACMGFGYCLLLTVLISEDESCTCWKLLECDLPFVNIVYFYLSVIPLK